MRNWQGKVWIDIREFYVKDGKQFPGKKGFFLSNLFYILEIALWIRVLLFAAFLFFFFFSFFNKLTN